MELHSNGILMHPCKFIDHPITNLRINFNKLYHYATTCATLQSTTLESQYSCHEKSGTAFAVHKFTSFFVYQYRPNLNLRSHYTLKYVYIYFTNHIGSMYVFFSLCSTQLKRYTRHQKKPSINSLFKDVYMVLLRLLSFVS